MCFSSEYRLAFGTVMSGRMGRYCAMIELWDAAIALPFVFPKRSGE